MPPTYETAKAKAFISVIFAIVIESLNIAMLNNEEIKNLLKEATLVIEQNGSVDSLFEQLALEIKGDPKTIAVIHMELDKYRSRIREALETNQIEFDPNDF